jgi:hypothetical protein
VAGGVMLQALRRCGARDPKFAAPRGGQIAQASCRRDNADIPTLLAAVVTRRCCGMNGIIRVSRRV